jgi:TonB family protein
MGAEVRVSPTSDVWTQWEGQVINGTLPLRRCLGMSDHSGVFLTEYAARDLPNAALKLVPLIPTLAESQLAHWAAAATLTHPNLIRLFETGRCQLGSQHYLYVVMDYAEQNLAHLLQHRPLSETEVREMLPLTLDALTFLHEKGLVQGQLKPSNVLVVGNQLKLASDTIRPAGEATASIGTLSLYNPPEARDGSGSTAGDIWALGVTLCQALTTRLPSRSGERTDDLVLPPDLPVSFVGVIRRCLIRNPAIRPTVGYLRDWLGRGVDQQDVAREEVASLEVPSRDAAETSPTVYAPAVPPPVAEPPVPVPSAAAPIPQQPPPLRAIQPDTNSAAPPPGQRSYFPLAAGAVVLVAIVWGAVHLFGGRSDSTPATAPTETVDTASPAPAAPNATTPPATTSSEPVPAESPRSNHAQTAAGRSSSSRPTARAKSGGVSESASVIHEEIPSVPQRARQTIHGRVKVVVLVTVDRSGAVVNEIFENPGPSRYFARLASEAGKKWKFSPAVSSRRWLVHFEFSREGTKVHATPSS